VSRALILLVGLIYSAIAAESAWRGNWPMGVVYGGYALSNVGLWALAQ
jgi:hypothetical protein